MAAQTGVSRRIQLTLQHLVRKEWESALVNLFPAIDATGKRRRPKDGVGSRVRGFLDDEQGLITVIATGNYFDRIVVDGVTIPEALYKFGRTSLMHEGELDPRLRFNEDGEMSCATGDWNFPISYISGMVLAVIAVPENVNESISGSFEVNVLGENMRINECWGQRERLRQSISEKFGDPSLFSRGAHPGHS